MACADGEPGKGIGGRYGRGVIPIPARHAAIGVDGATVVNSPGDLNLAEAPGWSVVDACQVQPPASQFVERVDPAGCIGSDGDRQVCIVRWLGEGVRVVPPARDHFSVGNATTCEVSD